MWKEEPLTLSTSEPEPDISVVRGTEADFLAAHPTTAGTYLAACVFYATLVGRTPVGLGATGGLSPADAAALQAVAAASIP